ncbi:hypothetical protein [Bombilactobacillus bombi]|nr:hypothetical protein [Bombilactobacillus bombi]
MQNEDNDFLMRQIKSFTEGLGYILSKDKNNSVEIVFPKMNSQIKK